MPLTFTATDVPPASRADYWREVLTRVVGPVDPHGTVPQRLRVDDLGTVRVGDLTVPRPGGATRTRRHIGPTDPHMIKVDVIVRGRGTVEQEGHTAELTPHDFTLVDLSRPARWNMGPVRVVALSFPRPLLTVRDNDLARLTAVPMPGAAGTGALISALTRQLAERIEEPDPVDRPRLGMAVLDLLTVALNARLDRGRQVPAEIHQRAMLLRLRSYIETHLRDSELSPATIAAAHHISLRYLHKLFGYETTTVARLIQRRRLERCRHDLLDPAQAGRPVSAIAADWGLTNPGHFSRLFRAEYGIPPTEYRVAHRTGRPVDQLPVDQLAVDQLPVDQLPVDQLPVD